MKNLKLTIVTGIFLVLILNSCQKDNSSIPDYYQPLIGSWKVEQGLTDGQYIIFNQDKYCYELFMQEYNFKTVETALVQASNGQVFFDGGQFASSLYNFKISHDTLYLTRPDNTIIASRTTSAPVVSDWVTELNVSGAFNAPLQLRSDIAYDGGIIWFGNGYDSDYLYKISLLNGSLDSIPTTQSAWAVERDNTGLWVSNDGYDKVTKISKTTGSTIFTSISLGSWIYAIAWDGQYLWCYSNSENTLYKYDPVGDDIISKITFNNNHEIYGLTYNNGYLYVTFDGDLAKCSLTPFKVIETYTLKDYYLYGITYDGTNFWSNAYNTMTNKYLIVKLEF